MAAVERLLNPTHFFFFFFFFFSFLDQASPGGGFGPVSDSGYGVSYMIAGEERLVFHISSKKSASATDSKNLGERIWKALDELKVLFSA